MRRGQRIVATCVEHEDEIVEIDRAAAIDVGDTRLRPVHDEDVVRQRRLDLRVVPDDHGEQRIVKSLVQSND